MVETVLTISLITGLAVVTTIAGTLLFIALGKVKV